MKDTFEELVKLAKLSKKHDPWMENRGVSGYCEELKDEADEVLEAFEKKDHENLKEEVGDLFMDIVKLSVLAADVGRFDIQDSLQSAVDKLKRRQPYILEGRSVTAEEARKIWLQVKAEEKQQKQKTKNKPFTVEEAKPYYITVEQDKKEEKKE